MAEIIFCGTPKRANAVFSPCDLQYVVYISSGFTHANDFVNHLMTTFVNFRAVIPPCKLND